MGKTRILIDSANDLALKGSGTTVFIDDSNQLIYDLKHEVRFINIAEFPISGSSGLIGFLSGLISGNYDIDGIFIDGLTYIVKEDASSLTGFFSGLKQIATKYNVKFLISINGDWHTMPEYLKEFL
jgi:hypothetical protein